MAKPKGTGTPSYERINRGLAATEEFKEYEKNLVRTIMSARVDGVHFEKLADSGREDGMPEHKFEVFCGKGRVEGYRFQEPGDLRMNVDALVTAESLVFVLATFGTKVRTFYCKESAVKDRFVQYVRDDIRDRHSGVLKEAELRIAQQARDLLASGRVERERQVAYENEAVEEIRKVLLKFRNIRRPALKRAIDEFIVHAVCDD